MRRNKKKLLQRIIEIGVLVVCKSDVVFDARRNQVQTQLLVAIASVSLTRTRSILLKSQSENGIRI